MDTMAVNFLIYFPRSKSLNWSKIIKWHSEIICYFQQAVLKMFQWCSNKVCGFCWIFKHVHMIILCGFCKVFKHIHMIILLCWVKNSCNLFTHISQLFVNYHCNRKHQVHSTNITACIFKMQNFQNFTSCVKVHNSI